jgi:hypothetical protein
METVNSLSGGKTSSYLAVHWPADYEIFSLVCVDDARCGHVDKGVMRYANDKLSDYVGTYGEFVGTVESPVILKTMMDLEQKLGKEIIWVRGESFDRVIDRKGALPNQNTRWCTTEMKIRPIFEWCYMNTELPVKMRVGYRMDEMERIERFSTSFKYSDVCRKKNVWQHKWKEIEWRVGDFVLRNTSKERIDNFWSGEDIVFPKDSNCQMCFWKDAQQILRNSVTNPNQISWANRKEVSTGNRFDFKMTIQQMLDMPIQLDFFETDGASCQSGECTN